MTEIKEKTTSSRAKQRIEREAQALKRNLAKRKIQQQNREKLKKEKNNGQD